MVLFAPRSQVPDRLRELAPQLVHREQGRPGGRGRLGRRATHVWREKVGDKIGFGPSVFALEAVLGDQAQQIRLVSRIIVNADLLLGDIVDEVEED